MKKIVLFGALLFLFACASLTYDRTKFWISPDVKLLSITAQETVRSRDGQMFAQIYGVSKKDQSVYYKIEWFDENSMKVSTSLSQWKKVNLRENMEFLWNAAAPSVRAVAYRVYVTDDIGNGIIE